MRAAIREGRLAPGAAVPSTRTLASPARVARGKVVEAYAQLAAEGWLRTQPGGANQSASRRSWAPGVGTVPSRRWTRECWRSSSTTPASTVT